METNSKLYVELEIDQENLMKALRALEDIGVSFKIKSVEEKLEEQPISVPSAWQFRPSCTVHNCPCHGFRWPTYTTTPYVDPFQPPTTGTPMPDRGVTITCDSISSGSSTSVGLGNGTTSFGNLGTVSCGSYTHPTAHPCSNCGCGGSSSFQEAINQALSEDEDVFDDEEKDLSDEEDSEWDGSDLLEKFEMKPEFVHIDDLYLLGFKYEKAEEIAARLRDYSDLRFEYSNNADIERMVKKRAKIRKKQKQGY